MVWGKILPQIINAYLHYIGMVKPCCLLLVCMTVAVGLLIAAFLQSFSFHQLTPRYIAAATTQPGEYFEINIMSRAVLQLVLEFSILPLGVRLLPDF